MDPMTPKSLAALPHGTVLADNEDHELVLVRRRKGERPHAGYLALYDYRLETPIHDRDLQDRLCAQGATIDRTTCHMMFPKGFVFDLPDFLAARGLEIGALELA